MEPSQNQSHVGVLSNQNEKSPHMSTHQSQTFQDIKMPSVRFEINDERNHSPE
jgi:hypothetical protein